MDFGQNAGTTSMKVELEVAGNRARREPHADGLVGEHGLLVVLAGFDVLGEVRRVAAEADDLLHVVLLDLRGGPERVGVRARAA